MNHALKLTAASLLLAGLAACGGGATDDDETTSTAASVTGAYWANNSLKLIWRFNSDGSGEFWQGSTDNQSCRHYQLQAVSVSSASVSYKFGTVKYYIAGSGVTTTSGAALGVGGTYSTNYSVSGSSATIGGDAYVKQSSFSYPNSACSYI